MAAPPVPIVDWEAVKEELDGIDESWKQPRFDSLTHVVEVLTSHNPEEATQTLTEQRDAIEALVDDVVRGYHKGFNKAIHNYSQILRLFSESATSLSGIKVQLGDCKKLLGARHKQLQQQWYRSVILRNVITLLDQIDNVAKVPAKIEHLISEKRYYAAVQLHIQSISMLEREGIQGVGALQDVRAEFSKLRGVLFNKVVEDLHSHLYGNGEHSVNTNKPQNAEDDLLNIESVSLPSPHPVSRRTRTFRKSENGTNGHMLDDRRKSSSSDKSSDGKDEDASQSGDFSDGTASENGLTRASKSFNKESPKPRRATLPWLAEATPNEFVETVTKSDASSNVKYLQTMVECLNLLGKTAAGGALISQRLRQTIHDLIADEIKAHASAIETSRLRVEVSKISFSQKNGLLTVGVKKVQETKPKKAFTSSTTSIGPTGPSQVASRSLVVPVLASLSRVLENHIVVGDALENAAGGPAAQSGDVDHLAGSYNLGLALAVIQNECQQFICDILRASPDASHADTAVQTAKQTKAEKTDKSHTNTEDGLSFHFRLTESGEGLPDRPARRRGSANPQEGYGTGSILPERGIYLISSLYRPVLEFTDKYSSLLPERYAQLGQEGLKSFIETFITDKFLPKVNLDYRSRVQDALASSAAFRPKARSATDKSPCIPLLGPSIADQLATDAIAWAHAMPKYAGEFLTLVHSILEKTHEKSHASYMESVLGKLSAKLMEREDMDQLMKQDPASLLLGSNVKDPAFNGEDMELELEMNNLLLSLRPIRQEQLVQEDHKFVLFAALSESLDALADSIEKLGRVPSRKQESLPNGSTKRMLPAGLENLIAEYRALSLQCLRTLRIEMQLQAIFHLESMSGRVYVSDQDAEEPEDFIITFTTQISRWDEEMSPYLSSAKRKYTFGGICGVIATFFIKALADMSLVNVFGVRQICRNCIALQQALAALSSSDADLVQLRLDRVRTYYELLAMPFEALAAFVQEHESEFSFTEFSNLLKVNVPGRELPADGFQRIGKILAP